MAATDITATTEVATIEHTTAVTGIIITEEATAVTTTVMDVTDIMEVTTEYL